MDRAHMAAVVTWLYAAGFGLPTVPVAAHLLRRGRLPTFFGLFPMYGGPWSSRLRDGQFAIVLLAFGLVTVLAALAAGRVWHGSKAGAVLCLALLPVEMAFWFGFALPIPWLLGIARVVLIALAWRALR